MLFRSKLKDRIMDELKGVLNPEFINRIDDAILFHPLEKKDIEQIIDIMMKELNHILEERKIRVVLQPKVKTYVAEKGYDKKFGARPLRRTIQRLIEDPLAEELLKSSYEENDIVEAYLKDEQILFRKKKTSVHEKN